MVASARTVGASLYTFRMNTTAIAVTAASAQSGATVNLSAALSRVDTGALLKSKALNFYVNGVSIGTATTYSTGKAYLNYKIPAGTATGIANITVTFAGDASNSLSQGMGSLTVGSVPTAVVVTSLTVSPEVTANISATLIRTDTNLPLAGKTVAITVNGIVLGSVTTDGNGNAAIGDYIPAATALGTQPISAAFAGDPSDGASSGTGTLTIAAIPTSLSVNSASGTDGAQVALYAAMIRTDTGGPVQGETVTFVVNGTTVGTSPTTAAGQANVTYTIPAGTAAGAQTIMVSFAGDAGDTASLGTGTLTVVAIPTAIAVNAVSGTDGAVVSLTATLTRSDTGGPLQGKTVTFSVNGTAVGTSPTYSAGQANVSYTIPSGTASRP